MTSLRLPQLTRDEVDPREVIRWAARRFRGRIAASSSFQTQSMPLLHMIGEVAPDLPILFLDTGYHFPDTLAFRDRIIDEWGLNVRILRGSKAARAALTDSRSPPYETDPDRCCWVNKVEPMQRAMREFDAWVSGIRRDQTGKRAEMQMLESGPEGVQRVHPLIEWTARDVTEYIARHDLPKHPLTARGYASIGCAPCTRRPGPSEDERAGRWENLGKTECGLHTELVDEVEGRPQGDARAEDRFSSLDDTAFPPKE